MKIHLWILVMIMFLLAANVYAHGDEEHSADEDTIQFLQLSVSSNQLILIGIAVVAASAITGTLWFMTGRQMPVTLISATLLTVFTGLIHLAVGRTGDWLLLANGAGYCAIALFRSLPFVREWQFKKFVTLGLIAYTMITFVGYFLVHGQYDIVGVSSKIVEVVLVIVLLRELVISDRSEDVMAHTTASPATH